MIKPLNRLVLGVLLTLAASSFAWIPAAHAGDDWQPIDPADLAMKDNPKSPGADAMILYRERLVNEPHACSQEYTRMKIFTKEGLKYANVEITYQKGTDSVMDIRGRTIHADGNIVNFDGKVLDKVLVKAGGVKVYEKSFSLPDVQPGSIIEYRYQDQLDEQMYYIGWEQWSPQGELFSKLVRFSIMPLDSFAAEGLTLAYRYAHLAEKPTPQKQKSGYLLVELHDIPGVASEELMPPDAAVRPRVEFFYRDRDEPRNETQQEYWTRIDKKWDRFLEKFVDKQNAMRSALAGIADANDSHDQKLRKIYARVEQIRNLNMEPEKTAKEEKSEKLKPNENVEDVLKRGYGSERDINMLLVALSRAAGFEATEVWVVPTSSDQFEPGAREASRLTADLVWVRAGGQEYYLDPGSRFYPFGLVPWFEAGAGGMRLGKDAGEFVATSSVKSSDATLVRNCDIKLGTHGDASGTLQMDFTGELAAIWRTQERSEDETGRKKDLGDEVRRWLPAGSTFDVTSLSNWDDITKPVHVEGTFKLASVEMPAGSRALVPVTLFHTRYADDFKSSIRMNPIDFSYPFEETDDIKYELPVGYTVESVPTISKVDLGAAVYDVGVAHQGQTVEIKRHLVMGGAYFALKFYPTLRFFFTKAQSNDQTQIVLQATQSAKAD